METTPSTEYLGMTKVKLKTFRLEPDVFNTSHGLQSMKYGLSQMYEFALPLFFQLLLTRKQNANKCLPKANFYNIFKISKHFVVNLDASSIFSRRQSRANID